MQDNAEHDAYWMVGPGHISDDLTAQFHADPVAGIRAGLTSGEATGAGAFLAMRVQMPWVATPWMATPMGPSDARCSNGHTFAAGVTLRAPVVDGRTPHWFCPECDE